MPSWVGRSIDRSLRNLGVSRLDVGILEIDLKGTESATTLADVDQVYDFYARAAGDVLATGVVERVFAYCHSPQHMATAMAVETVTGLAAQFSPAEVWPRVFFAELEKRGLPFFGMAPLWRGRLAAAGGRKGSPVVRPLVWALSHPQVTRAVLTMSSLDHWNEAMAAAGSKYDLGCERADFEAWGLEWPADRLTQAVRVA
ncbi:aldo-keto reductase family protein [Frankia sp. AgKG'84/4]|uniref:hypothetical protein n=1 Tax=Frankia sp. AgKG'84/4 TaxID=573490 RepID=UPI002029C34A|nr:hypothetical protein [Frankia sp. AgKG'84/4]MCL9795241.1 hypothetical protein [Frankia sp. AgKG'84/4]